MEQAAEHADAAPSADSAGGQPSAPDKPAAATASGEDVQPSALSLKCQLEGEEAQRDMEICKTATINDLCRAIAAVQGARGHPPLGLANDFKGHHPTKSPCGHSY